MKVFLGILLYIFCPECEIQNGPINPISYNVLGRGQVDWNININTTIIKDLYDYNNFYMNYYGTSPAYTDFDFNRYMIAVIVLPNSTYDIDINDIYETNDQITVSLYRPVQTNYPRAYTICGSSSNMYAPKTYFMAIAIKRSDKIVRVYS